MEVKSSKFNDNNVIITLRGIDPEILNAKYRSGSFMAITMPREKVTISGKKQTSLSLPGTDPTADDTYIIRTNCKGSNTFVTTNCLAYKSYTLNGKELKGGICDYCLRNFDWNRMGIILAKIQDDSTNNKYFTYWEGCFCDFGCSYTLAELLAGNPINTDKYRDAMDNIKELFEKCYPGKTLDRKPDYFAFTTRGGSIDPNKISGYVFIPHHDIITVPIKRVFEMKKDETNINGNVKVEEIEITTKKTSSKHKKAIAEVED